MGIFKKNSKVVAILKRWQKQIMALTLTLVALAGIALYQGYAFLTTPVGDPVSQVEFLVKPGDGMGRITQGLTQKGIVSNPLYFKLYARATGAATQIKTGEYLFVGPQTPMEILATLKQGKVKLYRFTIPEGQNMFQIARRVAKTGLCNEKEFLTLCRDPRFIRELKVPSHTLEGYLYPDTYFFPITATCKDIIRKMVILFHGTLTPQWRKRAEDIGFTVQEIVTLASMIEKETADAAERPLIASVFHNRLKRKMKLQSDPTVVYGDHEFKGRIRTKHLRRKTPYNTYTIKGLPLGPISNPGARALEAALYPATSDYLFFVSKNNSTHHFSVTLKEHNRAVRKYQLKRK